jgi:hypothetical protein
MDSGLVAFGFFCVGFFWKNIIMKFMKKSENGYGWTSTQGMEQFISRGMVGSVVIDTSYKSPISLVVSSLDSIL